MKRIITLWVLLLVWWMPSRAQDSAHYHTFLKFNPSTITNELDFYVEQELSSSMSLEAGGGFIFTDYWDLLLNKMNFGEIKPNISEYQYLHGMGYDARIGLRYYIISSYSRANRARGTYFEPIFLFKKVIYPNNRTTVDAQDYWSHALKYVEGLQLLIGRQYLSGRFILDNYLGLGVKAKTYHYDHYYDLSGQAKNGRLRTTNWLPSIQLGVKIGLQLQKRER
ncbi:MAG TPA: hypothetical protein VMV20_01095 [Chitinophagaceae bacterium]|nr:hypothetical protein [Chitinophagaceae bacterium]